MELEPIILSIKAKQQMAPGNHQPYVIWKALNCLRTSVGRWKANIMKWSISETDRCKCSEVQTMVHLLTCSEEEYTKEDMHEESKVALAVAK